MQLLTAFYKTLDPIIFELHLLIVKNILKIHNEEGETMNEKDNMIRPTHTQFAEIVSIRFDRFVEHSHKIHGLSIMNSSPIDRIANL